MPIDADLSELQLAAMRVLWDRGEATSAEVQKALYRSRGLAITTVATLLTRLEKRGLVTHRADGRVFYYRAVLEESDVRRSAITSVLRSVFRSDPSALLSQLVQHKDVKDDDIATMKKLLAESARRRRGAKP